MPKPVLFGEDYSAAKFNPRSKTATDPSRIEGYSEIVQANDISKSNDYEFVHAHRTSKKIKTKEDAYKQIGAAPSELPVEFKWLRITGPGGAHSPTAAAEIDSYVADQGFMRCTKDKFDALSETYGYKFNSTLWRVAEDGTICRGYDVALFYRSGEVARMWEKYLKDEARRAENSSFPQELQAQTKAETFTEEEVERDVVIHH